LLTARRDRAKDLITAIRAVEHAARTLPSARLIIVVEDPPGTGTMDAFESASLGPHARIFTSVTDLPLLLQAADLFLLTRADEGVPLAVIEAMAARLPIVAADAAGALDIVEHDWTGLIVPASDAIALADALVRLAADDRRRIAMGHAAQQRARQLFRENQMISAYGRLYDEILQRRSRDVPLEPEFRHAGLASDREDGGG
jgi:glycosyltransferase involved in cell wall biosynthesis